MGPDFPGEVSLGVRSCLPVLDIDVVTGDRLDGSAQELFDLAIGSAGGNGDIRGLHGNNDAAAIGNNLKRMTGGGDWQMV